MAPAAQGLAPQPHRSLDEIAAQARSPDYRLRSAAVAKLGEAGGARAVELLRDALSDPRKQVRARAAQCLGRLRSTESLHALAVALNDRTAAVRRQALEAIRLTADNEEILSLIVPLLRDPDVGIRYRAVQICGDLRDKRILEPLLGVAGTTGPHLRYLVMEALAPLRDLRSIPVICRVIAEGKDRVKAAALKHLRDHGHPALLPRSIVAAADIPPVERIHALEALRGVKVARFFVQVPMFSHPPAAEYCAHLAATDPSAAVRREAQLLSEFGVLLRGSAQGGAASELLRAAMGAEPDPGHGVLLRGAEAPRAPEPRPSLWVRMLRRRAE